MPVTRSSKLPRLIGMVHLAPLPGAPAPSRLADVIARAIADTKSLARAGFDGVMIENFGDAPFHRGRVPRLTVAAMTKVVAAVAAETRLPLGVNVLRNDAESALCIAAVTGAAFIRVNILVGAMVTDQGVIQGRADKVARLRAQLCPHVAVFADVMVKHAQPLGPPPPLEQLVHDTIARGGADAIIVTGDGTGRPVSESRLAEVARASSAPVYIGSGLDVRSAPRLLSIAHGAIVGSSLKRGGDPSKPIDLARARALISACPAASRS